MVVAETCEGCGFDGAAWTERDAATVLDALGLWWRLATDGVDGKVLDRRPAHGVWSAHEYGLHVALVIGMHRRGIAQVLVQDGVVLDAPTALPGADADAPPLELGRAAVLADVHREGQALAALARGADPRAWAYAGHLDGRPVTAGHLLRHALHDATHHLMDVGRGLSALGAGTPPQQGRVAQVSASDGGVPKRAVERAAVTTAGVVGDRQDEVRHHGRRFQALCLWSSEVIDELAALGHPVFPGAAGENITVSGIDWSTLRPGARLRIGTVLAEVSFAAIPCAKNARWFSDGDFTRIAHERSPGWVRWYAWVREPGEVAVDDAVVVQP